MNVRRPECDEQPANPANLKVEANQLTTAAGDIAPRRSLWTTGPAGFLPRASLLSARRRSGCIGIRRPEPYLDIAPGSSIRCPTLPGGSRTIAQSSRAISPDLNPALALSRTMTQSRRGYWDCCDVQQPLEVIVGKKLRLTAKHWQPTRIAFVYANALVGLCQSNC